MDPSGMCSRGHKRQSRDDQQSAASGRELSAQSPKLERNREIHWTGRGEGTLNVDRMVHKLRIDY